MKFVPRCDFVNLFLQFLPQNPNRGRYLKLINAVRQAICALGPTFEKLFTSAKVHCKMQKIGVGRNTAYENDPWLHKMAMALG